MRLPADLPDTLSLFPLAGALLLPRVQLPLHIFEPRYLALLDDVLKTPERLIGMVQPLPGAPEELHDIGCAGRVTAFNETRDGRYMIKLNGISRYRLGDEIEGFAPYRRAKVNWSGYASDRDDAEEDPGLQRKPFFQLLDRYFSAKELQTDWETLRDAEDEVLINSLAMLCPFGPEERQALLEANDLTRRRETMVTLMEYGLRGGTSEEVMQ